MKLRLERPTAYLRDEGLPADSQRVTLGGPLRTVQWPPLCPNCGAPATEPLAISKVFRRMRDSEGYGGGWHYVITRARVPFCPACVAAHASQVQRISTGSYLLHLIATPLVIPFFGAGYLAVTLFPDLVLHPAPGSARLVQLGLFAALLLAMTSSAIGAWWRMRFSCVAPPTGISSACDFSDELGGPVIGSRRAYAIRNPKAAAAFLAANQDRVWTEADAQRSERRQSRIRTLVLAAVGIAGLILWLARQ